MKKVIKTITEIENWDKASCNYCKEIPTERNATHVLVIRNTESNRLVSRGYLCSECKVKAENNEFEECEKCGRIFKRREKEYWKNCLCADLAEEQKLQVEPERYSTKLEKQLHELTLEKSEVEEELEIERDAHLAGVDATADWYKRVYEKEMDELKKENQKLKTQIKEITQQKQALQELLEKFQAQIEQPLKN